MKRCKRCGSIYGSYKSRCALFETETCPLCDNNYDPICNYHGGTMEMKKVGKIVDAHNHTIHLGVELETEYPTEDQKLDAARDVFRILNKKSRQFVKLERDGSLRNGFEIISQPIQLGSHLNSVDWKKTFEVIESHGGTSHESGRCGLHVHLDAYSPQFVKNIWNLVNKVYRDDIKLFSRRTDSQMYYCGLDNNDFNNRRTGHSPGCAVNTATSTGRTVEIRIFRGTLKYETFIETLRLVERLAWLALDNEDVMNARLPKFDTLLSKYGKEYMKIRRERGVR